MLDFTFALRAYAKFRSAQLAKQNGVESQRAQLLKLLRFAKHTRIGAEYNFETINSVEEYQKRLSIGKYEDFWEKYWKDAFPILDNITWPGRIPYFCWTSGTTSGKRKYIPYSVQMTKSYNKGGTDLLVHHINNRPKSKIFGGKTFMLGGTTALDKLADGVFQCEVSGVSALRLPFWARPFFFPPQELSSISNWLERSDKIAAAVKGQDIRAIGGMPSWLLIFFERFKADPAKSEGLLTQLFPNLELFIHGGVKFDPYLKQYQALLAGGHAEFRECYPASEGYMAAADRGYGEGLRLIVDHSIFYEFIPVEELGKSNPTRHWLGNLELNVNYAILLTNCSGMWSYILGDTVRFIEREPARLIITGRTTYGMSAFGEHLISEEIEQGVAAGADAIGRAVADFSVGVHVTGKQGDLGYHIYLVEFDKEVADLAVLTKFRDALDAKLQSLNDDYVDHRTPGCGLHIPQVIALRPKSFAGWMESKGKLGSQHKVPRVMSDRNMFAETLEYFRKMELVVRQTEAPGIV